VPSSLKQKFHKVFLSQLPDPSKLQDDPIFVLTSSIGLRPEEQVLTKHQRATACIHLWQIKRKQDNGGGTSPNGLAPPNNMNGKHPPTWCESND
jgi:hypothetical protein